MSQQQLDFIERSERMKRAHARMNNQEYTPMTRDEIVKHNQSELTASQVQVASTGVHPLEQNNGKGCTWDSTEMLQYIQDKGATNDHYAALYNVITHNRFGILETDDIDDYIVEIEIPDETITSTPQRGFGRGGKMQIDEEDRPYKPKKRKVTEKKDSVKAAIENRDHMFSRP